MSVYRWREAHCRFFTEVRLSVLRAFRGRSRHDTWSHPIGFRVSRRVRLKEETRTLAMDGNVGSQHIGGQASGKVQGTVRERKARDTHFDYETTKGLGVHVVAHVLQRTPRHRRTPPSTQRFED